MNYFYSAMKSQLSLGKVLQTCSIVTFHGRNTVHVYTHAESRFIDHFWIPIFQTTEASDFLGI